MFTIDFAASDSGELILAQKGTKALETYSADGLKKQSSIALSTEPTGLLLDGERAFVTHHRGLDIYHLGTNKRLSTLELGSGSCSPALSPDGLYLYVCLQFDNCIAKIDIKTNKVLHLLPMPREPKHLVVSKDGKRIFVANFLPHQRADGDVVAAVVSVVDAERFCSIKDIMLANGSNALRGMCLSTDGNYIYVAHNMGRFMVPTSQLQQGWMNTSALSVIDARDLSYQGAVIVDEPERGAAGSWDVASDEKQIYVTHSGTHDMSIIDQIAMIKKLRDYEDKEALSYDLRFLYGIRKRIALEGNGPRLILMRDADVLIPSYFSDDLNIVNKSTGKSRSIDLNPRRKESDEQRGERYFNDASFCFQGWQSCNGCHPGDGRTDGMNWDLMNDGVGNPKNCKSLLFTHPTPPSMITGIRTTAELAVRAGFTHIQFSTITEERARCVDAYLKSLRPLPSPYLVKGELSPKAQRGKKVYEQHNCASCHAGPYYTDLKRYRIGADVEFPEGWDTPTLREVWRTAPYLFDGRAATMQEVFSRHKHGIRGKISDEQLEALSEYVLSL